MTMTACCSSIEPHTIDPDDGGEHWVLPPKLNHPAKFNRQLLDAIRKVIVPEHERVGALKVLDPFAGVGGIHELADAGGIETFGVELQPEWARMHRRTVTGSVLDMPELFRGVQFDALVTSPCYGNRMADSHDARDECKACSGRGRVWPITDSGALGGPGSPCKKCKGSGLSWRNTYTHVLRAQGIEPVASDDNAVTMQWGVRYREFHAKAWRACRQVLKPGTLVVVNVKNHWRGDKVQRVAEFHLNEWLLLGCTVERVQPVPSRGNRQGANGDVRDDNELLLVLRTGR